MIREKTLAPLRRLVAREPVLLALLGFAGSLFVYRWLFDNNRPHSGSGGWHNFHDQGFYYLEAAALGKLHAIPVADFYYGPGYPMLAAPFTRFGSLGWPSGDSFFVADLAIWLLAIGTTFAVARRLYGEWFGVACALAVVLATPLVENVTTPWNTSATLAALMVTLLVALAGVLRWWHGAALGLALTLAYSARYVDAIWIAIAAGTVLAARGAFSWRSNALLAALISAYLTVLPTLYLQWRAFGRPFASSYRQLLSNRPTSRDFTLMNIPHHALQAFVSPFYFADHGFRDLTSRPMLATMFLAILAPVGLVGVVSQNRGARRTLALGYALASALATLFYLAYYFTGSYGLHFGAVHYFKTWWPLWTIAGGAGVVYGVERLKAIAGSRRTT